MHRCKICDNTDNNRAFEAKEMMFGFNDPFIYFQCSKCNCVQISEIPQNLSKYYPKNYYSFRANQQTDPFRDLAGKLISRFKLLNRKYIGKMLISKYPQSYFRYLVRFNLHKKSKILDVGCGNGHFLIGLNRLGFIDLTGVDPYIPRDFRYGNEIKILKRSIHSIGGKWDLISFNHSLEHMPDQLSVFQSIKNMLSDNGFCVIRIPVSSSYAWEHYGINWVQLDAPRHFFLHSIDSFKILAKNANLTLEEINYDSTESQFWGSEQYIRNIPLESENSYSINPQKSIFNSKQIAEFKQLARNLNANSRGDQATFVLRKSN